MPIVTTFVVDAYGRTSEGILKNFDEVSARWRVQDYVKFLFKHGKVKKQNNYVLQVTDCTAYEIIWELSEKHEMFARLKWAEKLDKTFN